MTSDHSKYGRARKAYAKWRSRSEGRAYIAILFSMNEGICPKCGVRMFLEFGERPDHPNRATLDHIVPLVETEIHDKNNLAICCSKCNQDKALERIVNKTKKQGGLL